MSSSSSVAASVSNIHSGSARRYRPRTILQWIRAWWLSIACFVVIGVESTDRWSAHNTKYEFYGWFNENVAIVSWDRWGFINWELRKLGHMVGFGLIALAFYYCWTRTLNPRTRETMARFRRRCALRAIVMAFLLAAADEIHQSFIPSRTAAVHDVVLDTFGALLFLMLWFGFQAFFHPEAGPGAVAELQSESRSNAA
jgi:hypothetical protein